MRCREYRQYVVSFRPYVTSLQTLLSYVIFLLGINGAQAYVHVLTAQLLLLMTCQDLKSKSNQSRQIQFDLHFSSFKENELQKLESGEECLKKRQTPGVMEKIYSRLEFLCGLLCCFLIRQRHRSADINLQKERKKPSVSI